ncbi:cell wall-binding repeat-containing protein [Neobacillus drentensis]|uniref:cell wall-binding repeat-containing protein n=1 Tax=Neobacillus drentensis TaxID=220684 RepID=UPI003B589934
MKKKIFIFFLFTLILSLFLSSCSNDNKEMDHANMNMAQHNTKENEKQTGNDTSGMDMKNMFANPPTEMNQNADLNLKTLNTKNITRLNANDPIETAVLVSQTIFPATHKENRPGTVILVPVDNWQVGLASADLIHHPNNGPILFMTKDGIPRASLDEIKRLNPIGNSEGTQVMVMGEATQNILDDLGEYKVETILATDSAEFAAAVDKKYAAVSGGGFPNSVIIVSSDDEAKLFSLSAINWIAHMPEPVLFVSKNEIPQATTTALKERKKANIYVLGSETVISSKVINDLGDYGKVTRIKGNDPISASIEFAKFKDKNNQFGWGLNEPGHGVSFISTESPELAIAAAPFSHLGKHAPLIWLDNGNVSDPVYQFLASIKPTFKDDPTSGPYNHGFVIGTQKEIPFTNQGILDEKLEIVQENGEGHIGH